MGTKKIIILFSVIILLVVGISVLGECMAAKDNVVTTSEYQFSVQVFLAEGGFNDIMVYSNSIFTESFCNANDIVISEAKKQYDFEHRYLAYAAYRAGEYDNKLCLVYKVPRLNDSSNKYAVAMIRLVNVKRSSEGYYSCENFSICINENDIANEVGEIVDINGSVLPLDANVKTLADYGVCYCNDIDFYTKIYDREKNRILAYLLEQQKLASGNYRVDTDPNSQTENVQPSIIDAELYFKPNEEQVIHKNPLDYETGFDDIINGKIYKDYVPIEETAPAEGEATGEANGENSGDNPN